MSKENYSEGLEDSYAPSMKLENRIRTGYEAQLKKHIQWLTVPLKRTNLTSFCHVISHFPAELNSEMFASTGIMAQIQLYGFQLPFNGNLPSYGIYGRLWNIN